MPHIIITPNSIKQHSVRSLRSVEGYLEQHKHTFEVDDFDKTITVEVNDKFDALRLAGLLSLSTVGYQSGGTREVLETYTPKKYGRPKNSIFTEAEGMTLNQYKKKIVENTFSKADIIKCGILTKTGLEKAIASNELETTAKGNSLRINKDSLKDFLNKVKKLH